MFRFCVAIVCFLQLGSLSVAQASNAAVQSLVNTLAQIRVYSESCGLKADRRFEVEAIAKIIETGRSEKESLERYIESTYVYEKERASGTCYLSHIENLRVIFEGQLQRAIAKAPERRTAPTVGIRSVQ